jgi:hypothetical protein
VGLEFSMGITSESLAFLRHVESYIYEELRLKLI